MNWFLIAAAAAAVSVSFAGGWSARARIADVDLAHEQQACQQQLDAQKNDYEAKIEAARAMAESAKAKYDAAASRAATKLAQQKNALDDARVSIHQEINDARSHATADCHFDDQWVRIYNRSLFATTGGASAASAASVPAGSTAGPGAAAK